MAELIDKKALLSLVNREKEMSSSEYSVGYIDAINDVNNMIDVLSTTTEAEIRAKAQREIVEWCFDNKVDFRILERYADKEGVVDCVLKHFTAEQLKEE